MLEIVTVDLCVAQMLDSRNFNESLQVEAAGDKPMGIDGWPIKITFKCADTRAK